MRRVYFLLSKSKKLEKGKMGGGMWKVEKERWKRKKGKSGEKKSGGTGTVFDFDFSSKK